MPFQFILQAPPEPIIALSYKFGNTETQDTVIVKTIIDMMKSANEDNPDLAITDEIILEAENALRKGLTKWTFDLEALKSATEGSF
jgi:hypothetical protein